MPRGKYKRTPRTSDEYGQKERIVERNPAPIIRPSHKRLTTLTAEQAASIFEGLAETCTGAERAAYLNAAMILHVASNRNSKKD